MSNKFNINALTQKHSLGLTDDVKYIREVVFVDEQKFLDEFDNLDPIVQHITFYYNNKPIACCRYFKADDNNNNSYQIGRIAVLKEYRGNGIGKTCDGHQRTGSCMFCDIIVQAKACKQRRQGNQRHGHGSSRLFLRQSQCHIPVHDRLADGADQPSDPKCIQTVLPKGRFWGHSLNQFSVFFFRHYDPFLLG